MSSATLLKVYKTKAVWDLELSNSYGAAIPMWDYFYDHHVWDGDNEGGKLFERPRFCYNDDSKFGPMFKLIDNNTIPLHRRLGLFLTCYRAVILAKHIRDVAQHFEILSHEITGYLHPRYSNHWPKIAAWFKEVEIDSRMIGVAMDCTSVSDVWDDYPSGGINTTSDSIKELGG